MEKYQVIEELAPGAFGTVFIVEENACHREKFAIKKVECVDEGEANRALKEAMVLRTLQHTNTCAYKDCFITWDNKSSSVFLCLVMKYLSGEDLGAVIQTKRENQEKIDETVIQMLLGQAVDALVHIHKQNLFHRNLKPSNIVLQNETCFVLGDFCVETLMNDEMKLKIRIEDEHKSWMSPEALKFSFTAKSDIWSLGCILLEMLSCPEMSGKETATILLDVRNDPDALKNTLQTMQDSGRCDASLCQVLLQMLQINPDDRATARKLADLPYVKECLALCGSSLCGLRKEMPPETKAELEEGGIERTLGFMENFIEIQDAQLLGLRHLSMFMGDDDAYCLRGNIVPVVGKAMRVHFGSMDIQLEGIQLLQDLTGQVLEVGIEVDILIFEAMIPALLMAIRTFPNSEELLTPACRLLMMITASGAAVEILGRAGAVSDVVQVLRRFQASRDICLSCSGALWSLAASESTRKCLASEGAVKVLCDVLQLHLEDGEVAESICCALWVLSLQGACSGFLSCVDCFAGGDQEEEVTQILLKAIKKHPTRPILVKNACLALASLLRTSEVAAFIFLIPKAEYSGISIIKECYQLHSEDPEVVEYITLLISELTEYDDVLPELRSQDMARMLEEIKAKFASSQEIVDFATAALLKLQQYETALQTASVEQAHRAIVDQFLSSPTRKLSHSQSAPVELLHSHSATELLPHSLSAPVELLQSRSATVKLPFSPRASLVGTPSHSASLDQIPSCSESLEQIPSLSAIVELSPSCSESLEQIPSQSATVEQSSSQSVIVEQSSSQSAIVEQSPSQSAIVEQSPSQSPSQSATVEQSPSQIATVEQSPSQSTTVEQNPSQSTPAEQAPSSNANLEQTPSHNKTPSNTTTMENP
ncbi:serine/threonine kinase-like domain-containing protein STKLD1 [Ambystoma mexicanum]|uniref:serine/threonine kinase-like domain-containing protein STKLD1 n=1 Tax=Ambystoma mexicanum TaxID=8296 RepID=UPI0037E84FAC